MNKQIDNLIIFDGVCNLCSGFIKFIFKIEKNHILKFTNFQNPNINNILENFKNTDSKKLDSVFFIKDNKLYKKSDAILKISKNFKFPLNLISYTSFIPKFIRDLCYDLIAKNRYKLFGKKETCFLPNKNQINRFID